MKECAIEQIQRHCSRAEKCMEYELLNRGNIQETGSDSHEGKKKTKISRITG